MLKVLAALMLVLLCQTAAPAVGFQSVQLPAGLGGEVIKLAIWYPGTSPTQVRDMGMFSQDVAVNGELRGASLPLVVISHGTGGYAYSHYDTALALANAGFVVAALTHPGDNYEDRRHAAAVLERPAQVIAVIDYMLGSWDKHAALAPSRIGVFGFSSGAFTALVAAGGTPNLDLVPPHCISHPADYACKMLAAQPAVPPAAPLSKQLYDPRIKAAVIAAPALGFVFDAAGLRNVTVPLQLWRAEDDMLLPEPWYAEAVVHALGARAASQVEYHVVAKAGHFDFLAPCSERFARVAPPICSSAPGFDRSAFHQRFNADVMAFFTATLQKNSK